MAIINKFLIQIYIKEFGWAKYETTVHPEIKDGWMTIKLSDGLTSVNMSSVTQYTLSFDLEK